MDARDILRKYERKIEQELSDFKETSGSYSREYMKFKQEMFPELSRYERYCATFGNIIRIRLAKKDEKKIRKYLNVAHLSVEPGQAVGLALFSFLAVFFIGIILSTAIFMLTDTFPVVFMLLMLLTSAFVFYYTLTFPQRLANLWRLKASSQMVPCMLYIVVYMKHTSNLERAIEFASQHLQPPLALDLKKIFWDVEIGKYSTIKASLDAYLERWREDSPEFIEAFHLVESSLYEPIEAKRIETLERALQVILDGIYERMLKYTHEIRAPLTNVYMLGIILPTLGLALLPLASALLQGMISWYHIFVLFNLIIPFFVFYMTNEILMKRPGGYGETELLELNPYYHEFVSRRPYWIALAVALPLFIIGLLPLLFGYTSFPEILGLPKDFSMSSFKFLGTKFFDFRETANGVMGPFGIGAVLLSLFIPLSIAIFFAISYSLKTRNLIKAREETKKIEEEFASSLFQLGNRLAEGIPAEIAFSHMQAISRGMSVEGFYRIANSNIQNLGMNLEQAIFDKKRGAIVYYPSTLIATSMSILVEGVKKGLKIAADSLMSISQYIKNIHKINERMRDLLAEIVSDMKSNATFLAPLLAGVVVGLASMITLILGKLGSLLLSGQAVEVAGVELGTIMQLFNIEAIIPPYFLQIAIGLYIIQVIFILTNAIITVESGVDKLKVVHQTARNLKLSITLYLLVALFAILVLSIVASVALGGLGI